jgi:hypothetical protein
VKKINVLKQKHKIIALTHHCKKATSESDQDNRRRKRTLWGVGTFLGTITTSVLRIGRQSSNYEICNNLIYEHCWMMGQIAH